MSPCRHGPGLLAGADQLLRCTVMAIGGSPPPGPDRAISSPSMKRRRTLPACRETRFPGITPRGVTLGFVVQRVHSCLPGGRRSLPVCAGSGLAKPCSAGKTAAGSTELRNR